MTEKNTKNLMELKESLKYTVRTDAQILCDFEEEVNDITFKKIGSGKIVADGDFIADRMMGDMCDRIINSEMSMVDKEFILSSMVNILSITKLGTEIGLMTVEERQKEVEEAAEYYIKKNKHIAERLTPTGGTTVTHKTVVVE